MIDAPDKAKALAERARDPDYWARLHERSDRAPAVSIAKPPKRSVLGEGVRVERGGLRPDKRP